MKLPVGGVRPSALPASNSKQIIVPNHQLTYHNNSNFLGPNPIQKKVAECLSILYLPPKHINSYKTKRVTCNIGRTTRKGTNYSSNNNNNNNSSSKYKMGKKWKEYQGSNNWEGLLDPLDDTLRSEILRYGRFVESAYQCFDFDPNSPTYARCKFPRNSLLNRSGMGGSGYKATKNLRATCGLQLPRWFGRAPTTRSSWIGYVAVCQDKDQISRLGRRDVVIAYRGTATCLEWAENLRAALTSFNNLPATATATATANKKNNNDDDDDDNDDDNNNDNNDIRRSNNTDKNSTTSSSSSVAMVESGFLSLYTSSTDTCPSLQSMVREEIERVMAMYGDEPLSFTLTGHSLGAALATLTAYDINQQLQLLPLIKESPMVTVISFGGPRVGNRSFGSQLENSGTRVLRIVNSDDVITKVPGFLIDNNNIIINGHTNHYDMMAGGNEVQVAAGLMPRWLRRRVENTLGVYSEVGRELRLCSKESSYLSKRDVATCHDLSTYLHLVDGFVSSTCT